MTSAIHKTTFSIDNLTFSKIREQAKLFTGHLYKTVQIPGEKKIRLIFRKILTWISATFVLAVTIPAVPFLIARSYIIKWIKPPKNIKIKDQKIPLTNEYIVDQLKAIKKSKQAYSSIEIEPSGNEPEFKLNDNTISLLKKLKPKKILLSNIKDDNLLERLETTTHYYTSKIVDLPHNNKQHQLELKEKTKFYLLPKNPQEMVEKLKILAENKLRVSQLYFSKLVPAEYENEVANYIKIIKPDLTCEVLNSDDFSYEELNTKF